MVSAEAWWMNMVYMPPWRVYGERSLERSCCHIFLLSVKPLRDVER